jgi:hypothetical protein
MTLQISGVWTDTDPVLVLCGVAVFDPLRGGNPVAANWCLSLPGPDAPAETELTAAVMAQVAQRWPHLSPRPLSQYRLSGLSYDTLCPGGAASR